MMNATAVNIRLAGRITEAENALSVGLPLSNRSTYSALQMNADQAIHQLRAVIRRQHKALATESAYVSWLRRYMDAVQRFPDALTSEQKLERFLTNLARNRDISASSTLEKIFRPSLPARSDGGSDALARGGLSSIVDTPSFPRRRIDQNHHKNEN